MLLDDLDISAKLAACIKKDPHLIKRAAEDIYDTMLEEIILGLNLKVCFEMHLNVKSGIFEVIESDEDSDSPISIAGLPSLKTVPQIECPNCKRQLAASRFAPHLEKCMGMGRNSSRLASRRLATSNKESYRDVEEEGEEGDGDEDWIEPGKLNNKNRKRDKNSPRRNKPLRFKGSGENADGLVTPPQSYDQLSPEERRQLLVSICGASGYNGKVCTRSTKCPAHTDQQRREIRLKWLSDDQHVDIDSLSEGDTAALRESLAQLSNASSPAESTISTSSNPSRGRSGRDKTRRGKKVRPGSKAGSSRGSTPPIE